MNRRAVILRHTEKLHSVEMLSIPVVNQTRYVESGIQECYRSTMKLIGSTQLQRNAPAMASR